MPDVVSSKSWVPFLEQEGLLPEECAEAHVEFPVDGPITIVYRVHVTPERLDAFRRAMDAWLEAQKTV